MISSERSASVTVSNLDSAAQLLLILARIELDSHQLELARQLAGEISDWTDFRTRARAHFILPLAYRHLRRLGGEILPKREWEEFRVQSLQLISRSLLITAAQRDLVNDLLCPMEVPFLLIKGHALAARYYPEPAERYSRDIDVLVPQKVLTEVIQRALSIGYAQPSDQEPWSRQHIEAMARYQPEITLISPRGVPVEFHSRLDKSGLIFDTEALLESRQLTELLGNQVTMLSTVDHFVYLCLHHTRHLWSHLHWLVDLDAILNSAEFDIEEVRARAASLKLSSTVDACIDMHQQLVSAPANLKNSGQDPVSDLIRHCLIHVQGTPEIEREIRKNRPYSDFAFEWQAADSPKIKGRFRQLVRLLKPDMDDYNQFPLPVSMHWFYFLLRPIAGIRRRIKKMEIHPHEQ